MVSYETYEIWVDFHGYKLTLQIMTNVVHTKNGSENMPIGNFCGYARFSCSRSRNALIKLM